VGHTDDRDHPIPTDRDHLFPNNRDQQCGAGADGARWMTVVMSVSWELVKHGEEAVPVVNRREPAARRGVPSRLTAAGRRAPGRFPVDPPGRAGSWARRSFLFSFCWFGDV